MQYGAVEISREKTAPFIVNGQRLKHYNCEEKVNYHVTFKLEVPLVNPLED